MSNKEAGVLTRFFERRALDEISGAGLIARGFYNFDTATGVTVSPLRALQASAVFACTRVLAEGLAMLPLHEYRRVARGREIAGDHYLYPLLHDLPNPEMTSYSLRELAMTHLCLRGNAIHYLDTNAAGEWTGIWPINPDLVTLLREAGTNRLFYGVELPERFGREYRIVPMERIWHVHGLSQNGLWGLSPIGIAAQSIGMALATEEYGARFFGNGAQPGFILKHPGRLKDDAYERLKLAWEKRHHGLENAHKLAILEDGMDVAKIGVSPEEAQFLETRKFQATEIARFFRVPPHMIADLDRATFSNIEQMSLEFVMYSLMPWMVRFEQEIYRSLLTPSERKTYFVKFQVDALLRGDLQTRYAAYAQGIQWGWLSINDVLELEDRNQVDNGNLHLAPLNMAPIDQLAGGAMDTTTDTGKLRALAVLARQLELRLRDGQSRPALPGPDRRAAPAGHTTAMVAFTLGGADAQQLAGALADLPEGAQAIAADQMHLTLAFLGETGAAGMDREQLTQAVRDFAAQRGPIAGRINGLGRFLGTEDGSDALYASFDALDLAAFRTDLVSALESAGFDLASAHGFVPHITLAYLPAEAATPRMDLPGLELSFGALDVYWNDAVTALPLGTGAARAMPPETRRGLPADVEQRAKKSAQARHRLANSYKRVIRTVAERVVRRESQDIQAQAKKAFAGRAFGDFTTWLAGFYRDHTQFIYRQMLPVLTAYGDLVADQAAEEIAWKPDPEQLDRFIRAYTNSYAARHAAINQDKLLTVLQRAQADGSDPLTALQAELDGWETDQPSTIADRESTRANNAVATTIYVMSGMVSVLRWVAFGESCPYCTSLDGSIVGIDENFLAKNQDFQPDGADRPLRNAHDVKHAPAHDGCDCQVVAGG